MGIFPTVADPQTFILGLTLVVGFGLFGHLMTDSKGKIAFTAMSFVGSVFSTKVLGWLPMWFLLVYAAVLGLYFAQKWANTITQKVRGVKE